MHFVYLFAVVFAITSTVLAVPTGRPLRRGSCDILGCAEALAPTVVSCAALVGSEGVALAIDGLTCLEDAADTITDFPPVCTQCLKKFDVVGKAKAAASAVKGAAEGAVNEVEDVAGKVF